jgi:hypothetical protein
MNVQYLSLQGITVWLGLLVTHFSTTSKVRFFKSSFTPNSGTPEADFVTNECDFDGYTPTGYALAAWQAPILGPGNGMSIGSPLVLVTTDPAIVVGNTVGGFWVEDAAGKVIVFGIFRDPIPMQTPGQGFPWNARIALPTGE